MLPSEKERIGLVLLGIHGKVAQEAWGEITWPSGGSALDGNPSFALLFLVMVASGAHGGGCATR